MSRKNDKIIVFGMMAIGILVMAGIVAILGLGVYVYTGEKPSPAPVPTLTPSPAATAIPAADLNHTFNVRNVLVDRGGRTYTMNIELNQGAAPVDMSRLTVQVVADGETYDAWDYYHGEHSSTGNSDVILDEGETFTLTLYMPQAGVPLHTKGMMKIILLVDGQTAYSIDATAV